MTYSTHYGFRGADMPRQAASNRSSPASEPPLLVHAAPLCTEDFVPGDVSTKSWLYQITVYQAMRVPDHSVPGGVCTRHCCTRRCVTPAGGNGKEMFGDAWWLVQDKGVAKGPPAGLQTLGEPYPGTSPPQPSHAAPPPVRHRMRYSFGLDYLSNVHLSIVSSSTPISIQRRALYPMVRCFLRLRTHLRRSCRRPPRSHRRWHGGRALHPQRALPVAPCCRRRGRRSSQL